MRGIKAGIKVALSVKQPSEFKAAGKTIVCGHCRGTLFSEREALLNTTGAALLSIDWLDTSGAALVCETCGLIQWFGRRPEKV
jgi:hypothetical protein